MQFIEHAIFDNGACKWPCSWYSYLSKYTYRQVEAFRSDPEILAGLISITPFFTYTVPDFDLQPPYRMQADPEAPAITKIGTPFW